jgi:hypothetical protein
MKTLIKKFTLLLGCLAMMVIFNSCSKDQEQVAPRLKAEGAGNAKIGTFSMPIGGCPTNYHWDNRRGLCVPDADPCEAVSSATLRTSQRNKAILLYGQEGGNAFDQIDAEAPTQPTYTYLSNYSSLVASYVSQIKNAIVTASNAYMASVSSTTDYNASTYFAFLNTYLNPLKTNITNDPNLTPEQRNVLLKAFVAINDNFYSASNLVTENLSCFPDPQSSLSGEFTTQGWFGNFLKKVVNVVATVIVAVAENAVRFAASFYTIGQTPESAILGGAVGAVWGLYRGIRNAIEGDLVCLFACP